MDSKVPIKPSNSTTTYCNQNINLPHFKAQACSCLDCNDACPVPVPPPVVYVCKIWSLDCLDVVFIILFIICSLGFIGILVVSKFFKDFNHNKDKSLKDGKILHICLIWKFY